ncbi:hypothetical protein [Neptuniibacter sp. QD37_11]|uniref:hypothetical protein n=1 Tax=Neptuniibacter sp. QD37_11 TaxID=3398209 RepID=UPI0039F5B6B7
MVVKFNGMAVLKYGVIFLTLLSVTLLSIGFARDEPLARVVLGKPTYETEARILYDKAMASHAILSQLSTEIRVHRSALQRHMNNIDKGLVTDSTLPADVAEAMEVRDLPVRVELALATYEADKAVYMAYLEENDHFLGVHPFMHGVKVLFKEITDFIF